MTPKDPNRRPADAKPPGPAKPAIPVGKLEGRRADAPPAAKPARRPAPADADFDVELVDDLGPRNLPRSFEELDRRDFTMLAGGTLAGLLTGVAAYLLAQAVRPRDPRPAPEPKAE